MRRAYATTKLGQIHLRFLDPRERGHPSWERGLPAWERGLPALDEGETPSLPGEPPLVCLHPFPYSGAFFDTIAPLLNEERLVCAPDCPGFGGSYPPARMLSMEELAMAMHEMLEACGDPLGKPFDLMGIHSGCLLAVEMARLQPNRVRKLALIDVPYFTPEEQAGRYPKSTSATRYTEQMDSLADAWEFSVARRLGGMPFHRAFSNFVELLRAAERANWGYHATLTYQCRPRFRAIKHDALVIATQYMLKDRTRKARPTLPAPGSSSVRTLPGRSWKRERAQSPRKCLPF